MTQRQLDLALLAGIGVLLLVILGLALSPAPTAAGDISDPAVRTPQTIAQSGRRAARPARAADKTPEAAAGSAENGANSVADGGVKGTATGAARSTPLAVPSQNNAADSATAETTAPPQLPTVKTPAGVPVERVGFAYATGGEGACGVPLTAWNYVAVSRDLLAAYPCGTAVTLTFADEVAGRRAVTAQVGDTVGAGITNTVNVFVGQDEPALEYGVTRGTLAQ